MKKLLGALLMLPLLFAATDAPCAQPIPESPDMKIIDALSAEDQMQITEISSPYVLLDVENQATAYAFHILQPYADAEHLSSDFRPRNPHDKLLTRRQMRRLQKRTGYIPLGHDPPQ